MHWWGRRKETGGKETGVQALEWNEESGIGRCNMRTRGQADAGAWETTNSNESITIGGAKL